MVLYVRRLEVVDDSNNKVIVMKDVRIDKALKKMVTITRIKDGDGVLKKIFKYLDEDYKNLLGLKNGKD